VSRVTQKQIDDLAERVSNGLRGELRIVPEGRYGYIGLDLYDQVGAVRTLSSGLSKRQAYDYLLAMFETLVIVGREL
jgi:hypothetical protein